MVETVKACEAIYYIFIHSSSHSFILYSFIEPFICLFFILSLNLFFISLLPIHPSIHSLTNRQFIIPPSIYPPSSHISSLIQQLLIFPFFIYSIFVYSSMLPSFTVHSSIHISFTHSSLIHSFTVHSSIHISFTHSSLIHSFKIHSSIHNLFIHLQFNHSLIINPPTHHPSFIQSFFFSAHPSHTFMHALLPFLSSLNPFKVV